MGSFERCLNLNPLTWQSHLTKSDRWGLGAAHSLLFSRVQRSLLREGSLSHYRNVARKLSRDDIKNPRHGSTGWQQTPRWNTKEVKQLLKHAFIDKKITSQQQSEKKKRNYHKNTVAAQLFMIQRIQSHE